MSTAFERQIDERLDTLRSCPFCGEELIDFEEFESLSPTHEGFMDILLECTSCPAAMLERAAYAIDAPNETRLEEIEKLIDYWNTCEPNIPEVERTGKDFDSETQAYEDAYSYLRDKSDILYKKRVIDTRFNDEDNPVVRVLFIKTDGSEREMYCTTCKDLIPEINRVSGTSKRAPNPNVKTVFDLEKKEWRCFRYDSVIEFE